MPITIPATGGGTYVVSLTDYVPPARFDGTPWTHVTAEEAATSGGTIVMTAGAALSPVDTDPAHPQSRDFTITGATLPAGWYRLTFTDADGNQQPTGWLLNGPTYTATREDVARLVKARTRDTTGNFGAFSNTTNPTAAEVDDLIVDATAAVASRIGTIIPQEHLWMARRAVALYAAMLVELVVTPEQTAGDDTAYGRLRELFEEAMSSLDVSLAGNEPNSARYGSIPITSPTMTAQNALLAVTTAELLP